MVLGAQAQTALPNLGDGQDLNPAAERRLGDRIARELYRDRDYLDDPVLGDYVERIWLRLLSAARQRGDLTPEMEESYAWRVALGRDRRVNAFALPGGYLGVHLGLIAVVDSEDELAAVLAHELSHVTQRHISRMISKDKAQAPWMMGAMILAMLAASRNPDAAGAMVAGGQAAAVQGQLNFSRDMEREADRIGQGILVQAGFSPRGAVGVFEKLQQAARHDDRGNYPYLRSHPLTTERIADMQSRQGMDPGRVPREQQTLTHGLMAARASVMMDQSVDALRRHVAKARALGGDTGAKTGEKSAALYAGVMAAMKLRDPATAWKLQAQLMRLTQGEQSAARLSALLGVELALESNQADRAQQGLAALAEGNATGRAEVMLRTQMQLQTGQAAQAAQQLQVWLAGHQRDAMAWQYLARAYADQGKQIPAIRAEAEAHASRLDYVAAYDRFQAAQEELGRRKNVDYVEASIVETRKRELESLIREQALER